MRMILLILVATAGLAAPVAARAETVATCKGYIDTVPAVITQGGTWCLDHDVSTAQTAGATIGIQANNVTLDCNGFKIGGLGAGPATANDGVVATGGTLNTTIRNCNIRGFRFGIVAIDAGGFLVERNRIELNTFAGVFMSGSGTLRDNQVLDTGGYGASAWGIVVGGAVDVTGNTVSNVTPTGTTGTAYGIQLSTNPGGLVERNIVRGLSTGSGTVYGIWLSSTSARVLFRGNDVMGRASETTGTAIYCQGGASSALLTGNSLLYFPVGFYGCVDAGRNVQLPLP